MSTKMTLLCEKMSAEKLLQEFFNYSGFIFNDALDSIVCRSCGFKTRATLSIDHIQFMHKLYNLECVMVDYKPEKYENFAKAKLCVNNYSFAKKFITETEQLMLYTFNSWPKRLPSVEKLVAAGFFYTGFADDVMCIECRVVLHEWNDADDPWVEHEKAASDCLLVKLYKL